MGARMQLPKQYLDWLLHQQANASPFALPVGAIWAVGRNYVLHIKACISAQRSTRGTQHDVNP